MSKLFSICVLMITILTFSSCEKKRGDAEACFDTGSATFTAGNSIRFMNCSKHYDATKWIVTDDMNNIIFTEFTDTLKHFTYSFNPGNYNVILNIWQTDSVSFSTKTESISVN
jgi:hypothetical protein